MVFSISAILWGILGGLLIAVLAMLASTADVSSFSKTKNGNVNSLSRYSRQSASSSSRKLEFLSLFIPTIGVIALNQLVLTTSIVNSANTISDIVGLQWY